MARSLRELLAEARRRRVFRTAGVYLVAVWGISQGAVELAPLFGAPDWALRAGLIAALALLPVVVVLAWMFDIGRSGIVRDPADVERERDADADLASMPTLLGADGGAGGVVVRWSDGSGEHAKLYTDEIFLGRGTDCRVRYYDPLVSRRHARIFPEDGAWYVEDLGSRNGTRVDGRPIERERLPGSSELRLNDAGPDLRVEVVAAGAETHAARAQFPGDPSTAHLRPATAAAGVGAGSASSTWKKRGAGH